MATQTGLTHLYGVPAVFVMNSASGSAVTGYVTPNIQSGGITHGLESSKIKSTTGEYVGIILHGEMLECTFDCIPEGSVLDVNFATTGSPSISARLPVVGGQVQITGLPIIPIGSFTDAFNTNATNVQRWVYEGGGSIKGDSGSHWTMTLPLKRYPSIAAAAVAT